MLTYQLLKNHAGLLLDDDGNNSEFHRVQGISRPRPSRKIPNYIFQSINVAPSPLKRIVDGNVTLEWDRPRWRRISLGIPEIQSRTLRGLIYSESALIGAVEFMEVRNATDKWMDLDFFWDMCDAADEVFETFASAVIALVEQERDEIRPREAFVEFSTLVLTEEGRSQTPLWKGVIDQLIRSEYESNKNFDGLILHALPLEFKGLDPSGHFYQRRLKAMTEHYNRTLGVSCLHSGHVASPLIPMGRLFHM